jgi:hypothetical protein
MVSQSISSQHKREVLGRTESKLSYDRKWVGQSLSVSSPIWGPRPDVCYCQTVAGLLTFGALSDEKTGLSLKLLLALANAVILGPESRGTHDHILLSQIRDSPNLKGHVSIYFQHILTIRYDMDRIEDTESNKPSIVACVFIAEGTCLPSHWVATIGRTHRHIPDS